MKLFRLILMMLVTLLSACFTGSGVLETKSFALADFDSIEINRGVQLEVTRGDGFAVSVTADDNLWDVLDVSLQDRTLHVELPSDRLFSNVTVHAAVSMPVLASVHASGGSHAQLSGFDVPLPSLNLHASGESAIEGDANANALSLDLSGASRATLTGMVTNATVDFSGTSSGTLTVDGTLDYHLSGGSHLVYSGNPQIGKSETSGGSSAEHH
jgi:hypothetical protein